MACCLCGPSGGGCCCGGYGLEEGEVLRRQQRQKLLETVRKMKGLSRNSRAHVPLDPLAVVEDARARMHAKEASRCCLSKPRACTWPLLLWLCICGAAVSSLQLKLIDVRPVLSLLVLENDTLNEFSRFFFWAVLFMMAIMSAAFVAAALRICNFISSMSAEVVIAAQEELRLDVSESVDHDFYAFVRRLREQFVPSEDFTAAAIRRAHRRLHSLLKARIGLVEAYVQGPFAVGREVEIAVAPLRCCMLSFLFFLPWLITMCLNLALLYVASNAAIAGLPDPVASPEEKAPLEREPALNDECFTLIVTNLLVNLFATVYLACAQTRCIEDCFASCLYSRIHVAVVQFCDRLVTRTWEEAVVCELVELLEGPRMGFERHTEERLNNALFPGEDDEHYPHPVAATAAAAFDPPSFQQQQQQQRLLTGDSCGGLPTAYQAAQQAPRVPSRSKSRSQCLALAPSTLWHDAEMGVERFSELEGDYLELEALDDLLPFNNQKFVSSKAASNDGSHSLAVQTPATATAAPPAAGGEGSDAREADETLGEVSLLEGGDAKPANLPQTEERMHHDSSKSSP